jgi:hypothetical protein
MSECATAWLCAFDVFVCLMCQAQDGNPVGRRKSSHHTAGEGSVASDSGPVKLFVSPASFTSFGPWMLLQHFGAKHDVVNVQTLDDAAREVFAPHFSPLVPSVCARVPMCVHPSHVPVLWTSLQWHA